MQQRPNIILIMTDEMRGDCMGFAGHPDVKTPYIDSLAGCEEGYSDGKQLIVGCTPQECLSGVLSQFSY